MGRGDKRTKKGKITIGSYGVTRPRNVDKATPKKEVVKVAKAKTETTAAAPKAKAKAKKASE